MVQFKTAIHILDTGFLTRAKTGGQLPTAMRINNGAPLLLKGVDFEVTSSANLDKTARVGKFSGGNVPLISTNPDEFTLRLILKAKDSTDQTYMRELIRLPKTLGVKALYYHVDRTATDSGANSTLDRDAQLITRLGVEDTTEPQGDITFSLWTGQAYASGKDLTDVKYVSCRFESVVPTQTASDTLQIQITGVFTD